MPSVYEQRFWDELDAEMWDEVAEIVIATLLLGVEGGTNLLPASAQQLVDYDYINEHVMEYAKTYRYDLIKGITDVSREATQKIIADWLQSGSPLSALEASLETVYGAARAGRIAVTEVTRVIAEGNRQSWEASGLVNSMVWMTAQDDLVCDICGSLDGTHIGIGDIDSAPPAHPNCILPDNVVIASDVLAATKSFYNGGVVELITRGGRKITVTKKHPILTSSGWMLADEISKGMYLFAATNPQRIAATINPNYNYRPATIEQVFCALKESSGVTSRTVPSTPEDFNGDGRRIDGNIEIVYSNSLLLGNIESVIPQPLSQQSLSWNNMSKAFFVRDRPFDFFNERNNPALTSDVSGFDLISPLRLSHSSPFKSFRFGLIAGRNARLQESAPKRHSIDARLASEFVFRFASDIAFDEVVDIRNFDYSGHVYDLQTKEYELYICNGIITHNCRCYLQPVMDDAMFENKLDEIFQ